MTLQKTKVKITHVADGVNDYIFSYDFRIDSESDIEIYYDDVLQTPTPTFANVTGLGDENGGNVEFASVPPACDLTIRRNVDLTQDTDYTAYGAFAAETHEAALDYLMMVVQQQQELIDRAYIAGPSELQPFIFTEGSIQHDSAGTALGIYVKNSGGTFQKIMEGVPDGTVSLFYSGNYRLQTKSDGIIITGDGVNQLQIKNGVGWNAIQSTQNGASVSLTGLDTGGTDRNLFSGDPDGAVDLYYGGSKKLETHLVGIQVTGRGYFTRDGTDTVVASKSVSGQYAAFNLSTVGSARWLFISTNEAESGGNAGSNFTLQSRADDGSYLAGFVKAWRTHNNFSGGVWNFQRPVDMGAYGIYFDPIDYDTFIAADATDDYIKVVCGNVTSMQLTNFGLILGAAKHLYMQNNTLIYCRDAADTSWLDMFRFNTANQLFINTAGYDTYFNGNVIINVNAKKLYGRATGGAVAQLIQMDGADRVAISQAGTEVISHGHFTLADDIRVKWGNSTDMSMYYAGTSNIGILSVGQDCVNFALQHWNGTSAENMATFYPNSGANFYYNNVKVASVISGGLSVWESGNESRWYFDSNVAILRNLHHGGGIALQAENSSGVNKNILFGDADGSTEIYAYGNKVLDVGGSGCTITSGTWDSTHLILGNYHIWVDSTGDLRIKSGAPTSDTDGTVVGSQS